MTSNLGRILLSVVAIFTGATAALADFNATHVFNPAWMPHARFHGTVSVFLALGLAAIALVLIWGGGRQSAFQLKVAAAVTGLYFTAFLPATVMPGTALVDPGFHIPHVAGIPFNLVAALVCLAVTAVGYKLARRELRIKNIDRVIDASLRLQTQSSGQ
jgi:hypothetical protein